MILLVKRNEIISGREANLPWRTKFHIGTHKFKCKREDLLSGSC